MSSLYISEAFLCLSEFSALFGEFEIQHCVYTGGVTPRNALFGLVKEINKRGSSIILTGVCDSVCAWDHVCVLCELTGVPAKGAWSQFSCQERLRLSTKSWKKGWVLLKTEKPTMLTRWSATSSSRSKENSCGEKWERERERDRKRLLGESSHIQPWSIVSYFKSHQMIYWIIVKVKRSRVNQPCLHPI